MTIFRVPHSNQSRTVSFLYRYHPEKLVSEHCCRISTPKLSPKELRNPFETPSLMIPPIYSLDAICQAGKYPAPSHQEKQNEFLRFLVIDKSTVVPYKWHKSKEFDDDLPHSVFVFCLDVFSNPVFFDSEYFLEALEVVSNTIFVFWNYPGQSYTIFSKANDFLYDNLYLANALDMILFELSIFSVINAKMDSLSFVGHGFGANILIAFRKLPLSRCESHLSTLDSGWHWLPLWF